MSSTYVDNHAVINNFMATISDCRDLAEAIAGHIDDHMDADPDAVTWADVSQAQALREALREITNRFYLMD